MILPWPRRGEVWLVNFNPGRGSEQQGIRPALIIQNDVGNRHAATTIVAAISATIKVAARTRSRLGVFGFHQPRQGQYDGAPFFVCRDRGPTVANGGFYQFAFCVLRIIMVGVPAFVIDLTPPFSRDFTRN